MAVIDNIDSFVYNLVQYVGELGAEPVVLRKDSDLEEIEEVRPERIIISPGPGRPKDAGVSVEIVRKFGGKAPILGVCLGHQAVAYAYGGDITPANQLLHGKTSIIEHDEGALFKGVANPFEATRYHSLVVDPSSLPSCLQVTAWTEGDREEIMGIKHKEHPTFGVQFHPESVLTPCGMKIMKNFLRRVRT